MDLTLGTLVIPSAYESLNAQKWKATFTWFMTIQENNVALSDDLVVAATKRFYALLPRGVNEKDLQFSLRWVQNFKKRYNIKGFTCHGRRIS